MKRQAKNTLRAYGYTPHFKLEGEWKTCFDNFLVNIDKALSNLKKIETKIRIFGDKYGIQNITSRMSIGDPLLFSNMNAYANRLKDMRSDKFFIYDCLVAWQKKYGNSVLDCDKVLDEKIVQKYYGVNYETICLLANDLAKLSEEMNKAKEEFKDIYAGTYYVQTNKAKRVRAPRKSNRPRLNVRKMF